MSQYYQDLKLKRVLAIYGCELKPSIKVGHLDVVAEDGKIILHGTIHQIRQNMGLTMIAYGEPIIHSSAVSFYRSTPIIKANRQAMEKSVTAEIEKELARINAEQAKNDFAYLPFSNIGPDEAGDSGCEASVDGEDQPLPAGGELAPPSSVEDALDAGKCGASADDEDSAMLVGGETPALPSITDDVLCEDSDDEPEIRGHVVSPPPGFSIPDNKIGALEESCRPLGISPTYTVTRRMDPATYYDCVVNLGHFETQARGSSKQKAKHNAASLMLYKVADADPFVKPSEAYHAELASGDLITYNERYVPLGLEDCHSPRAPRKATWAGVASSVAAIMPRLNRRQRREREFSAISQRQVDRWLEEPIADGIWNSVRGEEENFVCDI